MGSELEVSSLYRKMLSVSQEMLNAANHDNWDGLIILENERSSIVNVLQSSEDTIPDNHEDREILIGLIKEIQECDEKLRPLIVSWMAELRTMFESAGNELKLGKQYGSF